MKMVIFGMVFLAALAFGKGLVSNLQETSNSMQKHNSQIEKYYAEMHDGQM